MRDDQIYIIQRTDTGEYVWSDGRDFAWCRQLHNAEGTHLEQAVRMAGHWSRRVGCKCVVLKRIITTEPVDLTDA